MTGSQKHGTRLDISRREVASRDAYVAGQIREIGRTSRVVDTRTSQARQGTLADFRGLRRRMAKSPSEAPLSREHTCS